MFGSDHLVIEFLDGQKVEYARPDDTSIGWWHGVSESYPGVYQVMVSWEERNFFPLVSIRNIRSSK